MQLRLDRPEIVPQALPLKKIPHLLEVDRIVRCRTDPPSMGWLDLENVKGHEAVWPAMGGLVLQRWAVRLQKVNLQTIGKYQSNTMVY